MEADQFEMGWNNIITVMTHKRRGALREKDFWGSPSPFDKF